MGEQEKKWRYEQSRVTFMCGNTIMKLTVWDAN